MKQWFWRQPLKILIYLMSIASPVLIYAETPEGPSVLQTILSLHANQADWVFTGIATNENGEDYNYFLQIERNDTEFNATAALMSAQDNVLLMHEQSHAIIEEPELTHWEIGNIFLRFNPINNSWVFGVDNKKKKGFNFKVDTLLTTQRPLTKPQELRLGINYLISQTGGLNGHLQHGDKEEFVTGKKAWFQQIWVSKPQVLPHAIQIILCEFSDGGALYAANLHEADTLRGSIAGLRNEQGLSVPISQFINAESQKENKWLIRAFIPKLSLLLQNLLHPPTTEAKPELVIGRLLSAPGGFCTIHEKMIAEKVENITKNGASDSATKDGVNPVDG